MPTSPKRSADGGPVHDFKKLVICFQTANGRPHGDEGSGLRDACRGRPLTRAGAGRQGSRGSQGPGPPARAGPRVASGPLARAVHGAAPGPRASRLSSSSHEPRLPPPGPPRSGLGSTALPSRESPRAPSRPRPRSRSGSRAGRALPAGQLGPQGTARARAAFRRGARCGAARAARRSPGPGARGRRSGRSPALGTLTTLRCRLTSQRGNGRRPSCPGRSAEPTGADGLPSPRAPSPLSPQLTFHFATRPAFPALQSRASARGVS